MSIPVQTQNMHSSKHIMYVKDENGYWVRYLQAKNLRQLLDLFEKAGDENIEVVRIQRLRTKSSFIAEEYITIDPWDDLQVETALEEDFKQRSRQRREKQARRDRYND